MTSNYEDLAIFEDSTCECKYCYYGVYDCYNSCPYCDHEIIEELNDPSVAKFENYFDKYIKPNLYFKLLKYEEDCECFFEIEKYYINDIPKVIDENKEYDFTSDYYHALINSFDEFLVPC